MTPEKETSLILRSLQDLNETMKNLAKEIKKSNTLNEKFLLLEKKKTLQENKSTN